MAQTRQRRREVARAKWERQQVRRARAATRTRRFRLVGGAIVAVIAVALLTWLVVKIVQAENSSNDVPITPPITAVSDTPQSNQPTTPPATSQPPTPTHPTEATT